MRNAANRHLFPAMMLGVSARSLAVARSNLGFRFPLELHVLSS